MIDELICKAEVWEILKPLQRKGKCRLRCQRRINVTAPVMVAPHSPTPLGPRHPTPRLAASCVLIYVPSANTLQQE